MSDIRATPKPDWLRVRVPASSDREEMFRLMKSLSLHTVCEEANCPNLPECFGRGTATFMILGRQCTRNCTFCNVSHEAPSLPDPAEASHVAEAVRKLRLRHVVVTSVTRDDMPDGGAGQFAKVMGAIRNENPDTTVEVLIPDFNGDRASLQTVLDARPDILAHNVETVPSLYPAVRPMANYLQSLELLRRAAEWGGGQGFGGNVVSGGISGSGGNGDDDGSSSGHTTEQNNMPGPGKPWVKSGIMLGLGETDNEVMKVLEDLRAAGCTHLSIGQYLAPTRLHHPVVSYADPRKFAEWEKIALSMGFVHVASSPLARSSYHAEEGLAAGRLANQDDKDPLSRR